MKTIFAVLFAVALSTNAFAAGSGDPGGESNSATSAGGVSTSKSGLLDVIEVDLTGGMEVEYNVEELCGKSNPNGYPQGFEWSVVKTKSGKLKCLKVTYSNR
jgi:hypothetical protein